MANVKLGNNTLTGVTTVRLQNADAAETPMSVAEARHACEYYYNLYEYHL